MVIIAVCLFSLKSYHSDLTACSFVRSFSGCNFHNKDGDSIPLFTASATIGCKYAFPSPTYMTVIDGKSTANEWFNYFQRFDHDYPWDSKIRKVFWRGTLSESDPTKVQNSIRWRVNKYVADRGKELNEIFDVGFTKIPDYVISMAGVDASQAGGLKNEITPMIEFQKYIAILDMDGYVASTYIIILFTDSWRHCS